MHANSHSYGPFGIINQPKMHVFRLWEEYGVPMENLPKHGENIQTLNRKAPTDV